MPNYAGDFEYGQVVRLQFPTRAHGTGELTSLFQSNAGQSPLFELRDRFDGSVVTAGPPAVIVNKTAGMHEMVWDTTASGGAAINRDYDLYCVDGRVSADGTTDNWVNVSGEGILSFALQNSSSGFVLQRAVKVQTFQVESVVNDFTLVITGVGLNPAPDAYKLQNITWAPGAANFGSGYVIRSSSDLGGGQVRIVMQRSFAVTPNVGDGGQILPEERPEEQYWANIEAEWLPTDKYAVIWYNGTVAKLAEDTPRITVTRLSDQTIVVPNQQMQLVANSDPPSYRYESTQVLVPADDIAQITVSATIDGAPQVYSRVYPHAT